MLSRRIALSLPSRILVLLLGASSLPLLTSVAAAVELAQRDGFQDGTTQGWRSGPGNPNPPSWQPDGGPEGVGDGFLRIEASGGPVSGGSLVAFNTAQWSGDYGAAGVAEIHVDLRNLGDSELVVRLLLESGGDVAVTLDTAHLAPGSGWQTAHFRLDPAALLGEGDPAAVLRDVTKLRILHAPSAIGAVPVAGALGVDDVTAPSGSVCRDAGLRRGARAVCHVYCERLDCDGSSEHPRWRPRSSRPWKRACGRLGRVFERWSGSPPPCEIPLLPPAPMPRDADADGAPDAADNCPDDANFDQADRDGDGPGDVCDNCPEEPNPGQEDESGAIGVGDACECPCFTALDVSALILELADTDRYRDLECKDERSTVKPLTFVRAFRSDDAPCGEASQDCSALANQFTEDSACQLNAPAPAEPVLEDPISDSQREACRDRILAAAGTAGLMCGP